MIVKRNALADWSTVAVDVEAAVVYILPLSAEAQSVSLVCKPYT